LNDKGTLIQDTLKLDARDQSLHLLVFHAESLKKIIQVKTSQLILVLWKVEEGFSSFFYLKSEFFLIIHGKYKFKVFKQRISIIHKR